MTIENEQDLSERIPWSNRQLERLGKAMHKGESAPDGCPEYTDVMSWHSDLCAVVAAVIFTRPWRTFADTPDDGRLMDIASRAKTLDTLREKLVRQPHLKLRTVQDLAGVRVDVDCSLDEQTAFADELAEHFRQYGTAEVRDIRKDPHSGYRAVHVWLRMPSGRVEIQVRTRNQSAWANTYERLGDFAGRHIRYGERDDRESIQNLVEVLHRASASIAELERADQRARDAGAAFERIAASVGGIALTEDDTDLADLVASANAKRLEVQSRRLEIRETMDTFRAALEEVEGTLGKMIHPSEGR